MSVYLVDTSPAYCVACGKSINITVYMQRGTPLNCVLSAVRIDLFDRSLLLEKSHIGWL